jgi:ABC-type proline/glycine betaine transport system permease subunit
MNRATVALSIVVFGIAVCFGNDWIHAHYSTLAKTTGDFSIDPVGDLFVAAPFGLIAILVLVGRFRFVPAAATCVLLALLTSAAYYGAWAGETSTSALALLLPWALGIPGILLAYAVNRVSIHWSGGALRPRRGSGG